MWDNAQGTLTTENITNGLTGRLRLGLSQQAVDEGCNLAMERPVTLELRVDERPCFYGPHLLVEENSGSHLGTYVINLRPEKGKAILETVQDCL